MNLEEFKLNFADENQISKTGDWEDSMEAVISAIDTKIRSLEVNKPQLQLFMGDCELAKIQENHERLKKATVLELRDLQYEFEKKLQSAKTQYERDLAFVEKLHAEKINQLNDTHNAEINDAVKEYRDEIEYLQKQLEELSNQKRRVKFQRMKTFFFRQMRDAKKKVQQLNAERAHMKAQLVTLKRELHDAKVKVKNLTNQEIYTIKPETNAGDYKTEHYTSIGQNLTNDKNHNKGQNFKKYHTTNQYFNKNQHFNVGQNLTNDQNHPDNYKNSQNINTSQNLRTGQNFNVGQNLTNRENGQKCDNFTKCDNYTKCDNFKTGQNFGFSQNGGDGQNNFTSKQITKVEIQFISETKKDDYQKPDTNYLITRSHEIKKKLDTLDDAGYTDKIITEIVNEYSRIEMVLNNFKQYSEGFIKETKFLKN